jgi:hypothetical protein
VVFVALVEDERNNMKSLGMAFVTQFLLQKEKNKKRKIILRVDMIHNIFRITDLDW